MSDDMRPDVAAAWDKVPSKMGRKRDIKKLPEYLNAGEVVLAMAGGATGGNNGLLVATDRRALFVSEGVVHHSFEDFPYDRVTTVTTSRGMLLAKVVIGTAGASRVIDEMSKGEAEMISAILRERIEAVTRERAEPQSTAPATAPVAARTLSDELRELTQLKAEGLVSEAEFDRMRAKLLGG